MMPKKEMPEVGGRRSEEVREAGSKLILARCAGAGENAGGFVRDFEGELDGNVLGVDVGGEIAGDVLDLRVRAAVDGRGVGRLRRGGLAAAGRAFAARIGPAAR